MKPSANYRPLAPTSTPPGWLPAQTAPRAIVMHFLSRVARGHTWNSDGAFKRRGLA